MLKNLYIHVGTNKTGTSAIQKFLSQTSQKLLSFNCIYPIVFRDKEFKTAHHTLSHLLKTNSFDQTYINNLTQEVCESKCENVILSSEDFHTIKDVNAFSPLFDCFENVRIIIYIRDCYSYALSWYQQNSQFKGSSLYFDDFVYLLNPNLIKVVNKFRSLRSKRIRLDVREYDRSKFRNQSILYDFVSTLPLLDENSEELLAQLVDTTLFQNPSICGNLLYLRMLQSATYNDRSIIENSYNFFTKASGVNKERFQGLCYINLLKYPALMDKFSKQNSFFNNKYNMNLELTSPDPNKASPNLDTIYEDFTNIKSLVTESNIFEASLLPLLSLRNSFTIQNR